MGLGAEVGSRAAAIGVDGLARDWVGMAASGCGVTVVDIIGATEAGETFGT